MSFRTRTWIACTSLALAGCSFLNPFDDASGDGSGGGGGQGGALGSGGADATGGVVGSGGTVEILPGLVVVGGDADGNPATDDQVLLALSPQTGKELARREGNYSAAVHEAERDIWFLMQGDKVRAAKFDRGTNEWKELGAEATAVVPVDALQVFALNGSLAVLGAGAQLSVYDTSKLDEIKLVDAVAYPSSPSVFWGAVGVPSSAGGNVHVLSVLCDAVLPCTVQLTRIKVDDASVQAIGPALVQEMNVTTTNGIGSIAYNATTSEVVVVVPDLGNVEGGTSVIRTFSSSHLPLKQFSLPQKTAQPRWSALDPCQGVIYVMVPPALPMLAAGLFDGPDRGVMDKAVGVNGQGMFFEPYTRSLLLLQKSGDSFAVNAWSVSGTSEMPNIKKRISNWQPPQIRPSFASVALPKTSLCE